MFKKKHLVELIAFLFVRFVQVAQESKANVASKSFTPDITPLILAAHKDNYEIIKILLDRGEQITEPVNSQLSISEKSFSLNFNIVLFNYFTSTT